MIKPPLPKDEAKRLAALRALRLLDTPLEERFERITRLAQEMFHIPITSFTLIDEARQWFKSTQGLEGLETSRDISFCAHAILGKDVMIVPDARRDARFADNPSVAGTPNIGFYAGCPVRSPDGQNIGALCIIDHKPRNFSEGDAQHLRDLAAILETELRAMALTTTQLRLTAELDESKRLALIDPATRVWNDAGVTELLRREWAECIRRAAPLTAIIVALDGDKGAAADLLPLAARRLMTALRAEDTVGRRSDDSFLLVIPGCAADLVATMAERLRIAVERPVEAGKAAPKIGASFGATSCQPTSDQTIDSLIRRAEGALSIARKSGGSRIVVTADAARTRTLGSGESRIR